MTPEKLIELENVLKTCKTGGCSSPGSHAEIFEIVINIIQPKEILEFGFFCGASSNLLLELSSANITSIDPIDDNPTTDYLKSVGRPEEIGTNTVQLAAAASLTEKYPDRFTFIKKRTLNAAIDGDLSNKKFDLCYVDGDHWEAGVTIDLNICLALKIPFLLLDDANPEFAGVLHAVGKMKNRFQVLHFWKKENGDGADVLFLANLDVVKIENK